MTCDEYRDLLDQLLDGDLSPEDEQALLEHESECPACAELHASLASIQDGLSSLAEDVPPVPEDFHASWTQKLEEVPVEKPKKRSILFSSTFRQTLAVSAAVILLVGGTLLTRDQFPRQASTVSSVPTVYEEQAKSSSSVSPSEDMLTGEFMAMYEEAAEEDAEYEKAAGVLSEAADSSLSQTVTRTADIELSTRTFDDTLSQLEMLCSSSDASSSSASVYTASDGLRRASMTVRVPGESYSAFLSSVLELARVTRLEETSEDMTDVCRDLSMRLDTQLALMERLEGMVSETASMADRLELENQIAQVQYEIDSLRASLRQIDGSVEYSSVTFTICEEGAAEAAGNTSLRFSERISGSFRSGWQAFCDFLQDMLLFTASILPFLVLAAAIFLLVRFLIRRRRRP